MGTKKQLTAPPSMPVPGGGAERLSVITSTPARRGHQGRPGSSRPLRLLPATEHAGPAHLYTAHWGGGFGLSYYFMAVSSFSRSIFIPPTGWRWGKREERRGMDGLENQFHLLMFISKLDCSVFWGTDQVIVAFYNVKVIKVFDCVYF